MQRQAYKASLCNALIILNQILIRDKIFRENAQAWNCTEAPKARKNNNKAGTKQQQCLTVAVYQFCYSASPEEGICSESASTTKLGSAHVYLWNGKLQRMLCTEMEMFLHWSYRVLDIKDDTFIFQSFKHNKNWICNKNI